VTGIDLKGGMERLDRAISLFEGQEASLRRMVRVGTDPRVACYTTSALTLQLMGFSDQALRRADAALALASRLEHPFTSAYAKFHVGLVHLFMRNPQQAHVLAMSLLETAEEHGFRIWIATGRGLLGASRVALGRTDEGLADIRSGMALYQDLRSPPIFWPFLLFIGAGASHAAGLHAEALNQLEPAIELVSEPPPGASMLPEMLILKGDILVATGAQAEAQELYLRAYERAEELGSPRTQVRAAIGLARAGVAASDRLRRAYNGLTEGFEMPDAVEARELLAAETT